MEGLMFGLVVDDTLYIKSDDFNRFEFDRLNLGPFVYTKNNKPMPISYFRVPDEALDSSDAMMRWAQPGFDSALRARKNKP